MDSLVSIIVPVFNCERYLPQCLDSISKQDYKAIEVLLINDGSSDLSGVICDSFCAKDNRFRAFHLTNHGASASRNFGLLKATGSFVTFIDSDDIIAPNHIRNLANCIIHTNADIAVSSFLKFCKEEELINYYNDEGKNEIYNKEEGLELFFKTYIAGNTCCKLYKREVLNGIMFDTRITLMEDSLFFNQALLCSDFVCLSHCRSYFYRQHHNSVSKTVEEKRVMSIDFCVNRMLEVNKELLNKSRYLFYFLLQAELGMVNVLAKNRLLTKENYAVSKKTINTAKELIRHKKISFDKRVLKKYLAFKTGYHIYLLFCGIVSLIGKKRYEQD